MHLAKFYPVGNGDTSQIILNNEKRLIFDFCHRYDADDSADKRIDLVTTLQAEFTAAGRTAVDIFALTHLDEDHLDGASDFFHLEHAALYQGDGRIIIDELWVPAGAILETGLHPKAAIWRQEARHRLRNGQGIRVFGTPKALESWLNKEGMTLDSKRHLITDAGQLVPGFTLASDGVEFFVHSPFSKNADGTSSLRNDGALILHATFEVEGRQTSFLIIGDTKHEILEEIVDITRHHNNDDRLIWDLYNIPHHCSYLSLGPDKGSERTQPVGNVQWLLDQCQSGALAISSSKSIPSNDDDVQPPHRQAAATYRKSIEDNYGRRFVVTMEHPTAAAPKVVEVEIGGRGVALRRLGTIGSQGATSRPAPRAGR